MTKSLWGAMAVALTGCTAGGLSSLVAMVDEPAGTNCASGGVAISVGPDTNGDGVLGADEIEDTRYVCDGAEGPEGGEGAAGADGAISLIEITSEDPGANCPEGGMRVDHGIDDNDNGVLDTEEIDGTDYVCSTSLLNACTITFDDAWAALGQGADPEKYYGPQGVHFDNGKGFGLIGGVGNGDPGNWDIEGTNGSAAWGVWGGPHGISFDRNVARLSLDFLRGFIDYTVTVEAFVDGASKGTFAVSPKGEFDAQTMTIPGAVDELTWDTECCYGVDNVQYISTMTCP